MKTFRKRPDRLPRAWIVPAAIAIFLVVALFLSFLMARVVLTMRDTGNQIDNLRATNAAHAALVAAEKRLVGTVHDNAAWNSAFKALEASDPQPWIEENWGSVSADYPLYDGVAVTDPQGRLIAGYLKGEPADLVSIMGPEFVAQAVAAAHLGRSAKRHEFRVKDDIALVASEAVRPEQDADPARAYNVLTFLKLLTPATVDSVAGDYQLAGLRLTADEPAKDELFLKFTDPKGATLGYLAWPGRNPGTRVFEEVKPILTGAAIVLFLLLAAVLLAGFAESRELRRLAAAADHEARHDSLSGLLNRSGLMRALEETLSSGGQVPGLTLHLIDLDGFKAINDAWGHSVGDQLIRAVAARLTGCHPDLALVARLGGDEFALAGERGTDPKQVADTALAALVQPFRIGDRLIELGASIGYATSEPAMDAFELIRRADVALYRVKETGKGRALAYTRSLDRDREDVALLEDQLRRAIDERTLEVAFQPVVSAQTGAVSGVEALARWTADRGPVRPDIFIPLAEKAGLIDKLGAVVMEKAIRFAKARPGIELSVNVSPLQLCASDFPESVLSMLEREAFDPGKLILEVTEGVLIASPDLAQRAIQQLRARGIRFALDDFGSGYASIGALRTFGFDRMKIDRSLVTACQSESGLEVFKATVALASALSIPVTAEGIETPEQARIVRETGCQLLQGYLAGRPMSPLEFEAYQSSLAGAA